MEIEYGTQVVDRDGKTLGTIDYVIRNSWTGEISKFRVRQNSSENELLLSLGDILEQSDSKIKVNISSTNLPDSNQDTA
jgi:sporulation protein YlmC with PRC-barrel domain